MRRLTHVLAGVFILAAAAALDTAIDLRAQTPPAGGQAQDPPADRPTFRTSATLITIDAVVTDKDGNHVTDLSADDFELTYGGRRRELQHVMYVSTAQPSIGASPPAADPKQRLDEPLTVERGTAGGAIRRIGRPAPGRTIAIVVDDLGLSFRGMADTRRALRKFVDEQMEHGDLVAIVRTAGGMGTLQQFTTDRRLLHIAIERVQWSFMSRGSFDDVGLLGPGHLANMGAKTLERLRERMLATGSLGAIEFIARGMQHLPGRKAIVLFTEGFGGLFEDRGESGEGWRALERMLERVNRSGVVIYPVHAAGLQTGGLMAEHHIDPRVSDYGLIGRDTFMEPSYLKGRDAVLDAQAARRRALLGPGEQLRFIAEQTGGVATIGNNDLNAGFRPALEDQRGYYLLGFEAPAEKETSAWSQGRFKIRVKRSGVRLRARRGPFGPADPRGGSPDTSGDPLLTAALSPFGATGMTVRLTALFGHDVETGPYIRTLLFIDTDGLTFARGEDGRHESRADIAQVAVGDNGQALGSWGRTVTLSLTDAQLEDARTHGLVYGTRMAVERPGPYQVRSAVRDTASSRLGSASQFLEVPEVRRGRLALSGVLLRAEGTGEPADPGETTAESTSGDAKGPDIVGTPAVRIFRPGGTVAFAYEIYDGTGGKEPLEAEAALLRDGQLVYRSQKDSIARQADGPAIRVIPVGGLLSLGEQMPAGTYTLQVTVGSGRKRQAAQWMDFDVQR